MKRILVGALALMAAVTTTARAQSLDDLNIQFHGYATQGLLYTTNNNMLTTASSDGSPAWTEAVINISAQPLPKLRIAVQPRYFLLGNYGNGFTLDYAVADYKVNDRFGVRAGKIKVPTGLFNEIQDIDPSYTFALLPQGPYSIAARNSVLSDYGGLAYGTLNGGKAGKLEYRGFGGVRSITADDGNFLAQRESGTILPFGLSGTTYGAALHWKLPVPGLMIGASDNYNNRKSAPVVNTPTSGASVTVTNGTEVVRAFSQVNFFTQYEHNKLMAAGEFYKSDATQVLTLVGKTPTIKSNDNYAWYAMVTYKVTEKLTAGSYYTQEFNHKAALGPSRYNKDLVLSARYDFNQYFYAKAEEHLLDGTLLFFDTTVNPLGLQPSTKATILKVGASF